jgi:hypothetical protein
MKAKHSKDEDEGHSYSRKLLFVSVALMFALVLAGLYFYFLPRSPLPPRAAIIDQLSSSNLSPISQHRNESLINMTKELLYKRFRTVDYYSNNATVSNYKSLASLGYKFIVWLVHSALDIESKYVAVSTSERYDPSYDEYRSKGQLTLCNITGDPNLYIAITPKFVEEVMDGRFEDTVIVFASCNGLKPEYYKTAEAFRAKGAKVFIGWTGWIENRENDYAIPVLLQYLIDQNNTIEEAVSKIPSYFFITGPCELKYYPLEVANYQIPYYNQGNVTSNVEFMASAMSKGTRTNRPRERFPSLRLNQTERSGFFDV